MTIKGMNLIYMQIYCRSANHILDMWKPAAQSENNVTSQMKTSLTCHVIPGISHKLNPLLMLFHSWMEIRSQLQMKLGFPDESLNCWDDILEHNEGFNSQFQSSILQ